jgi:hypothetical protein
VFFFAITKLQFFETLHTFLGQYRSYQMQGAGNPHNFDGKRIDWIARRWVNNLHQYDYVFHNYSIASNLNPFVSVMNYVIFEQDSWPASQHTHQFNYSNGKFLTIKYRSWQSPYHGNRLSRINNNNTGIPSANGYIGHTEGIYYIMQGF